MSQSYKTKRNLIEDRAASMRMSRRLPLAGVLTLTIFLPGLYCSDASADSASATKRLEEFTQSLARFRDTDVATAEGYVHYDGYDTFSMGEHWYNRDVYESGACAGLKPSHLQYLVIGGKRTLVGVGYLCVSDGKHVKPGIFGTQAEWHAHGPAWCLLPNGAAQDYQDLADALPNELTSADWRKECKQEGGAPASQDVVMLHTWNWISAPNGRFAHENLAIPFLRVGLASPGLEYLDSEVGRAVIRTLKLAHGDTQWWYWRGFNLINANDRQRRLGWRVLQEARQRAHAVQERMVEVGDLQDSEFGVFANDGDDIVQTMQDRLATVLTAKQVTTLNEYLKSLHTRAQQHGHGHE